MKQHLAALALALLLLPAALHTASAGSPLPPGESEDLTISVMPDGSLAVWYGAVYPIEALNETAQLLKKTTAEGATLTITVIPSTETYHTQLDIYGENLDTANASAIATALGKTLKTQLTFTSFGEGYATYTASIDRVKLSRILEELRPQTEASGFATHLDTGFLQRFRQANIVAEIVKTRWGVSTSFEVRAVGGNTTATGNRYRVNILENIGVQELKPSKAALLNILFIPPFGSKILGYKLSPGGVNASTSMYGIESLYIQLHGALYIRELVIEFEYQPAEIDGLFQQLADYMSFIQKLEETASLQNRTSHTAIGTPSETSEQPESRPDLEINTAEEEGESEGIAEPETAGAAGEDERIKNLPPVSGPENLQRLDPLTILAVSAIAATFIVFTTVYVRGGLGKAAKGAAATALTIALLTSAITPLLAIKTVYAEEAGGGLEPLIEVEQYIPGGAPPDLEIPLLFPSFKQINAIKKTFIDFEEIKVLATPSLQAPYNPQGLDKLLATLGIDLRLIQAAGLILGGGGNPLGMFKGLTLAHGGTSAFLPHENVGANVYMVFKAKPSSTLQSMLDAINTVYKIGYFLYQSTICFPGDGCLHWIGRAMMITALLAAIYLAITAPGFMVYAHASYPTEISSELKASTGYMDGPEVKDKERVWLSENRYMVSLAILIMILKSPTLSGWRSAKNLAEIPLTASFHVSSDADSGWTLTSLLGVYSGDRGLKVGIDFRDAVGIMQLFQILSTAFSRTWSSIVSVVAGSLDQVSQTIEQAEITIGFLLIGLAARQSNEYAYLTSALSKLKSARTLLSDARIRLMNYNCEGALDNINGAKENIRSAINDLINAAAENAILKDIIAQLVNQLERTVAAIDEFSEKATGLCAPANFKAEPPSDPESLPEEQRLSLTYLLFSATPLVTKAVHSKGGTTLTLRAYYGWNPLPQMAHATAVTVRLVMNAAREAAYNTLDQVSSITSAIPEVVGEDLNLGTRGLFGGLGGIAGSLGQMLNAILGPLQEMVSGIKNLLTSLKDNLISFLDRLTEQIRAVFDTLKKTLQNLINQVVSAITNLLSSFISGIVNAILGPLLKGLIEPLVGQLGLIGKMIAQVIQDMISNFIKEQIDRIIQDLIGKFVGNIFGAIDEMFNKILEPVNKIKEKINEWHQQIMDLIDQQMEKLLGPIYNVLSLVNLDISKLPGAGNGLNLGSAVSSAVGEFSSKVLSKARKTVEEAIRKLNEQERKILGALVRARDAFTALSSLIRIPIIGRGGQLQATLLGVGESAVSDDYGNLGVITVPHDIQKSIAGWYHEYTLFLHSTGMIIPIQADYSLVAPPMQELIGLLSAAPPSILWVKVNEVGPVLRGQSIDIAILGDPNRPSVPGGRESSRLHIYTPDGTVHEAPLDELPIISPFFPFPPTGDPPEALVPMISPFFPFPPELLANLEPGALLLSYSLSIFETPVEDPSARSVPRVLVPADTATGTLLIAPFFPFPPVG